MSKDVHNSAKEIYALIHDILWNDWDPIGIKGIGTDDEYDGYIGQITSLLRDDWSEREIAIVLGRIVTEVMGLQANPQIDQVVAKKLKAEYESRFAK